MTNLSHEFWNFLEFFSLIYTFDLLLVDSLDAESVDAKG